MRNSGSEILRKPNPDGNEKESDMARWGKTHGMTKTRTYQAWLHMKQRCYCLSTPKYPLYGGRGITVCARWLNSFENFLSDMGERPSPKHSLDRIDGDGDYTPDNCRWATYEEQWQTRRDRQPITYAGRSQLLPAWAQETGIGYGVLKSRLRLGWTVERALTTPVHAYHRVSC
jgi:hypothetical protein